MHLPFHRGLFVATEVVFWTSAAILFYTYVGYPALLNVLSACMSRRRPEPDYFPSISLLISAYNEERAIGRKLEQALTLRYPVDKVEILVLSDASTDGTDAIVASFRDPRIHLLRMNERRGKTCAQNQGIKHARGEVIVFSDATTEYHPDALLYLAANYKDPQVGAVSGRYKYFDPTHSSPTGQGTISFWDYENSIKRRQSLIKTLTGCCGCIYSVRRDLYTELASDVISDLVQPLWVIKRGYRVAFEDRALAYEETTNSAAQEFAMRVRVVTRAMHGILTVPDLLLPWKFGWVSFQLVSHKLLRWFAPFFLISLFLSSLCLTSEPWFRYVLLMQASFYAVALLSLVCPLHKIWTPLGIPLYFCTLNAAALLSIVEVRRGRKYVIWETVRS